MILLYNYITSISLAAYTMPLPILFDIFDLNDAKSADTRLGSFADSSYKNATK